MRRAEQARNRKKDQKKRKKGFCRDYDIIVKVGVSVTSVPGVVPPISIFATRHAPHEPT